MKHATLHAAISNELWRSRSACNIEQTVVASDAEFVVTELPFASEIPKLSALYTHLELPFILPSVVYVPMYRACFHDFSKLDTTNPQQPLQQLAQAHSSAAAAGAHPMPPQ